MNRRILGMLGVGAALVFTVAGCKGDPLSDADGSPAAIVASFTYLQMAPGDDIDIFASVVDGRSTPLEDQVTFAPCDADVAVTADPTYQPVPLTRFKANVAAVTSGASCVQLTGGGLTSQVTVAVLPVNFGGVLSSTTPQAGSTLTISSTTELKFDVATVSVTFGGGIPGAIASKTVDQLQVIVPFSSAGPLTINGVNVTYAPGVIVPLLTAGSVTQTGDFWGTGDTAYTTAPSLTLPSAAGTSTFAITNFGPQNGPNCAEFGPAPPNGSIGPCVIYKFTLAAATQLRFSADWDGTADVDIYTCDNTGLAGCFESGGSGAGSSHPETIATFNYPAGDHYFVMELWSGARPTNLRVTITRP